MSSSHIFFIPAILLAGAVLGYIFGRRMLVAEQAEQERAFERKAARQAKRAAASSKTETSSEAETSSDAESG